MEFPAWEHSVSVQGCVCGGGVCSASVETSRTEYHGLYKSRSHTASTSMPLLTCRAWKFPVTAATESAVSSLPAFNFDPTAPCGQECTNCCAPP